MKTGTFVLLTACMLLSLRGFAAEQMREAAKGHSIITIEDGNGCGPYAGIVPEFKLKDCNGASHDCASLYKERGMLLMVTVPNLTQYERQKKWEKLVKQAGWPQENAPKCVILQDMSQSGHRDKALRMMQDKVREDNREVFLVDETGDVRRSFGVRQDETVLLLIDSCGCVVHHETDEVEPDRESAQRVAGYVRKLAAAARAATISLAVAKADTTGK